MRLEDGYELGGDSWDWPDFGRTIHSLFQILADVGDVEIETQQRVEAALLDLPTRLPSRHGFLGDVELIGDLFLRQTELLALVADLGGG